MKPADVALWERFMQQFPNMYDFVQYDVPVGQVPSHALDPVSNTGRTAEMLYKRKIDVVAFKGEQIDIIELKPSAGLSAIGQVNGYRTLYMRDYSPPVTPKAIIVTDSVDPDAGVIAHEQGVMLVVV
jgi:hypothetical protein